MVWECTGNYRNKLLYNFTMLGTEIRAIPSHRVVVLEIPVTAVRMGCRTWAWGHIQYNIWRCCTNSCRPLIGTHLAFLAMMILLESDLHYSKLRCRYWSAASPKRSRSRSDAIIPPALSELQITERNISQQFPKPRLQRLTLEKAGAASSSIMVCNFLQFTKWQVPSYDIPWHCMLSQWTQWTCVGCFLRPSQGL